MEEDSKALEEYQDRGPLLAIYIESTRTIPLETDSALFLYHSVISCSLAPSFLPFSNRAPSRPPLMQSTFLLISHLTSLFKPSSHLLLLILFDKDGSQSFLNGYKVLGELSKIG